VKPDVAAYSRDSQAILRLHHRVAADQALTPKARVRLLRLCQDVLEMINARIRAPVPRGDKASAESATG